MVETSASARRKLKIIFGTIAFVAIFTAFKFSNADEDDAVNNAKVSGNINTTHSADSKIPDDFKKNNYYPKAQYPKLYEMFGDIKVKKIESMIYPAAMAAAKNSSCDRIAVVEISEKKSTLSDGGLVFFVDCENGKRFYISELDVVQ